MNILIVEDEFAVADFLSQALGEAGYGVEVAVSVEQAKQALMRANPDLLLLDVMLPDGDGFSLVREIRTTSNLPVLMVTAKDGLTDRVRGLDEGADDYLVKPFRLEELLARVRALLRRHRGEREQYQIGNLSIDLVSRRIAYEDRVIFLSSTEYGLLEILARGRGALVSKAEILTHVWKNEARDPNLVEVYVNYLRHKLERVGAPKLIHTVRSKGYILAETRSTDE